MDCKHKFTMCRLCLSENESFIDIFQVNAWLACDSAEVIRDLLQFQVSETDGYPHVLCSVCLGKLMDFKQFKEQCLDSRDTYNNVFASDESDVEYPIDIEEVCPVKLEPEDLLDTQEAQKEADLDHAEPEEEETVTVDIVPQIRKCSVALTSLEYLASHQKSTRRESDGPYQDVKNCVNDDGKASFKRRENVAVDANPCENIESSGPAGVGEMDVKVRRDCESAGERERGEETPLGVNERDVKRKNFRCGKDFKEKDVPERRLGVQVCEANRDSYGEKGNLKLNCRSEGEAGDSREKGPKKKTQAKRVEGIRRFFCDLCRKGFPNKAEMKRHFRVHSGERPFACTICGRRFNDKSSLRSHRVIHTGEKPYRCEVCPKQFGHITTLINHRRIHSGERPYACEVCGRHFTQSGSLARHRRTHTGEKPFVCDVCGKKFAGVYSYTCHRRIHSGEKPYTCGTCNKSFRTTSHYKSHLKTHTGEKPHVCEVCNKRFRNTSHLKNHLRIHSREKPYSCVECHKSFSDRSYFGRHLKTHLRGKTF